MIEVTCAIIIHENKFLAVQRGPETDHPFQWEFPGGKISNNESAEESIRREIQEELSVEIEIIERLDAVEHDYGIKQIRLIPFVCRLKNGELHLTEHISMKWFDGARAYELNWSEADLKLIRVNAKFMNCSG